MERLGPAARGRRHPGRPARPPRGPHLTDRDRWRRPRALCDRGPQPAADRGARGRGAVRRRPEGSSAMPHKHNPIRTELTTGLSRRPARLRPGGAFIHCPLARARQLSLRRRGWVYLPRFDDRPRLHPGPVGGWGAGIKINAERMRESLHPHPRRAVQPAGADRARRLGNDPRRRLPGGPGERQRAWDTGTEFRDLWPRRPRTSISRRLRLRRLPHPHPGISSGSRPSVRFRPVVLYTCGQKKHGQARPSLRQGGPGSRRGRLRVRDQGGRRLPDDALDLGQPDAERAEVKELSGTNEVPILPSRRRGDLGLGRVARWAKEHPRRGQAPARPGQRGLPRRVPAVTMTRVPSSARGSRCGA